MKFRVKVLKTSGETYTADLEADSKTALFELIKGRGDTLVSYVPVDEHAHRFTIRLPFFGIKTHDKIIIARNLGAMIEAGLSVTRALSVMEKQMKNKKLKVILGKVIESIGTGKTLSDSLAQFPQTFSTLFVAMVRAGEESGSLAQSLKVIANQQESSYLLTKKVRGAMMYPSIILLAMCGIAFFMLTYIVPTLASTFRELNVELPLSTRIVIGLSDFLKDNMLVSLVGIISFAAAVYFSAHTKRGKRLLDGVRLRIPIIGNLVKQINSARTARTMSSLLSAGVDMLIATQITREVLQNTYYQDTIAEVERRIQKGEPISVVFSENERLYPAFVSEMVSVGEETGQLSQMFMSVATYYENEVDQRTKDMSTIIEPFLMIVIGAAVGFFALSMIGPIYSLGDNL